MTIIEPTPARPEQSERSAAVSWRLRGTPEQQAQQLLDLAARNAAPLAPTVASSQPSSRWRSVRRAGVVSIVLAVVLGAVAAIGLFLVTQEAATSSDQFGFPAVMFGLLAGLSVGLFGATAGELSRQRRAERERVLARARRAQSVQALMNRLQHTTLREVQDTLEGRDV